MYYAILDTGVIAEAPSINKLKAAVLDSYGTEAAMFGEITVAQKVTTLRVVSKVTLEETKR